MSNEPRPIWKTKLWGACDSLCAHFDGDISSNAPSPSTVTAFGQRVLGKLGEATLEATWRLGGRPALLTLALEHLPLAAPDPQGNDR